MWACVDVCVCVCACALVLARQGIDNSHTRALRELPSYDHSLLDQGALAVLNTVYAGDFALCDYDSIVTQPASSAPVSDTFPTK